MGSQFHKEMSKFGYFKMWEKVRIKLKYPRKLAVEMKSRVNQKIGGKNENEL